MSTTEVVDPPDTDTEEFDFSQLDPANLIKGHVGEQTVIPQGEAAPSTPTAPTAPAALDPLDPAALASPTPPAASATPVTPTTPTTPEGRPEGVNMRKLREAREAAEKERDQFRTEREALAAKLADLEPRAKTYEAERETLAKQIEEKDKALAEAQAAAWRVDARTKPEWQEKATAIRSTAEGLQKILELPVLRDAGIGHSVATLLDPNPQARPAINEVIRALNESGHYTEAAEILQANLAVNNLRADIRRIEEGAAKEAEAWLSRSDETAMGVVRGVRESLAAANPIFDPRSPEFLSLAPEQQKVLEDHHVAAAARARAALDMARRPDQLVAEAYKAQLSLGLMQQREQALSAQMAQAQTREQAVQKELADLKARLATYERAAGGATGATGGGQSAATDDPAEIARMLDPRNMPGYRGVVG